MQTPGVIGLLGKCALKYDVPDLILWYNPFLVLSYNNLLFGNIYLFKFHLQLWILYNHKIGRVS